MNVLGGYTRHFGHQFYLSINTLDLYRGLDRVCLTFRYRFWLPTGVTRHVDEDPEIKNNRSGVIAKSRIVKHFFDELADVFHVVVWF